jgi:hypothetical protein
VTVTIAALRAGYITRLGRLSVNHRTGMLTILCLGTTMVVALGATAASAPAATRYDTATLAGKVAAVSAAGLQVRFSGFVEQEAANAGSTTGPATPITPTFVLSSPLDGTSVLAPDVTVNQDTAAAPQNETAIVVDPANPKRVVAAANDYVSRTWSCTIASTPCSALGDGYSGTYFSNNGGQTWCCSSSDPSQIGTLIPGVEHLTGGPYDAGGDPSVAFDSRGNVYYAGLGFDRASPPNTVTVSRGTFDNGGALHWGSPTFLGATTSPSVFNDKSWIAVDPNPLSPFRDRVYVTWTRFIFSAHTGSYVQSPIMFASSSDAGRTFSRPRLISGSSLYDQGSRPVVAPDGSLYVFFEGSTRSAALSSTDVVKSTDGGATWSAPLAVSALTDSANLKDTAFRLNSFPAAAAAPNGDLYATWSTEATKGSANYGGDRACAPWLGGSTTGCQSVAVYSRSADAGARWSPPAPVFAAATRAAVGYPVTQTDGSVLDAPPIWPVEQAFPAVAVSPDGHVLIGAYAADVVSPWQTCASAPPLPEGRINCLQLGNYIDNGRLDYVVNDLSTGTTQTVSTHPINTRDGFGGGFFGDYTDLAAGTDGNFHAFWTDSNNQQSVVWFYGLQFTPTPINQEDVVTASGNF